MSHPSIPAYLSAAKKPAQQTNGRAGFAEALKHRFNMSIDELEAVPSPLLREDITRRVWITWMGGLITEERHVRAAIRFDIPVNIVLVSISHWESGQSTARADFATLDDYLGYPAARHKAGAERRALDRALETNPFTIPQAVATARALAAAIDALPIGRDIRARLKVHLDAHIASLEALATPAKRPAE